MRNFLFALFISQGIPMLLMGDEYGHTRRGNNNPYVQDNDLNWFLWDQQDPKIVQFVTALIALRKEYSLLRHTTFLTDKDIQWHASWNDSSRFVSYSLKNSPDLYIAFNANFESATITLPPGNWKLIVNTADDWVVNPGGPQVSSFEMMANSALLAKKQIP
jgi:isoamylase/glycogen operon protein